MRDDLHFRSSAELTKPLAESSTLEQRGTFPADGRSWTTIETIPYDGRNLTSYVTEKQIREQVENYENGNKIEFFVSLKSPLLMNDYIRKNNNGSLLIFVPEHKSKDESFRKLFSAAEKCKLDSNTNLETFGERHIGKYIKVENGWASVFAKAHIVDERVDVWDKNVYFEGQLKKVDNGSVVVVVNGLEQVWPNPVRQGEKNQLIALLQNPWCMQPLLTACSGFTTLLTQNYQSPLELFSVPWNGLGDFSKLVEELKETIKCYVFQYDTVKHTPRGRLIQRYANASNNHPSNFAILPGRKPDRIEVDGVLNIMTFHYSKPRLVISRFYSDTTWAKVENRNEVFVLNEHTWIPLSMQLFDRAYIHVHTAGVDTTISRSRNRGILGKVFKVENYKSVLPRSIEQLEQNLLENKRRSEVCSTMFVKTYKGEVNGVEFSRPFVILCLERNIKTIRTKYAEYVPSLNKRMTSSAYYGFSFIEFVEDMLLTESLSNTDRAWIWLYCTNVNDMDSKIYSVVYGATMAGKCDYSKLECPDKGTDILTFVTDLSSQIQIAFKVFRDIVNKNAENADLFWAILTKFVTLSGLVTAGVAAQTAAASTAASMGSVTGFFAGIFGTVSSGASFLAGLGAAISSIVSTVATIVTFAYANALIIITLLVVVFALLVIFAYVIVKSELDLVGEFTPAERTIYKRILYKDFDGNLMQYETDAEERVEVTERNSAEILEELQGRCKERKRIRKERDATIQFTDMAKTFEENFLRRQREVHGNPLDRHRVRREKQYKTKRLINMNTLLLNDNGKREKLETKMFNGQNFTMIVIPKYGEVDIQPIESNVKGELIKCTVSTDATSYTYNIWYYDESDDQKTNFVTVKTLGKTQMNFPDTVGREFEILTETEWTDENTKKKEAHSRIRTAYSHTAFLCVWDTCIQIIEAGRFGTAFIPEQHTIAVWPYEERSLPEYYKFAKDEYILVRDKLIEIGSTSGPPIAEALYTWGGMGTDRILIDQLTESAKANTTPPDTVKELKRRLRYGLFKHKVR